MSRIVEVVCDDARLRFDPEAVVRLFHFLDQSIAGWRIPQGELAIRFVDEDSCRLLHADFFNDPDLTDVMTFPGDPEDDHAGDLAVCPAYAASAAPEHGSLFAEELTLYLIHGWLHLAGLSDLTDATTIAMRKAEATVMTRLQASGMIPPFGWNA